MRSVRAWPAGRRAFLRPAFALAPLVLAGCAARALTAERGVAPALPVVARVLSVVGVPAHLAAIRLGTSYAALRTVRPASVHSLGIGRVEAVREWSAFYFFDDPPPAPGMSIDAALRREPTPGQALRRVWYQRSVSRDSAEGLWAAAVAHAQAAAGATARCAQIGNSGLGPDPPDGWRRLIAYVQVPPTVDATPLRIFIGVGIPDSSGSGGRSATTAPRAGFRTGVEDVPEDDLAGLLETGAVACPPAAAGAR